ncbi:MAG: MiaB/RimO family radical SAM methylthiotransferase, partial [Dehalococcoidia bacterium]|nr:MiaB/RimO family radical SAM methylthiotransferase [Dehalococcoidia bacterium]
AFSDELGTGLAALGLEAARAIDEADLVILNSCVVRQSAENRVTARVDSLKSLKKSKQGTVIVLAGCMVDSGTELMRRFPHVDLFTRPGESAPVLDLVRARAWTGTGSRSAVKPPTAFVTIIEGCDNFCSYCIVPYRRGRERSRPVEEIVRQVERLAQSGVKEVTLLGQNVDSYGHDLAGKPDLAALLTIVEQIDGLARVRFLTSHPKDMSLKLIRAVASLPKVCESINLPAQSGDDCILKAMRRGYTSDDYRALVRLIREHIPAVAISTDIIVGFPGETEEQFRNTLELLTETRFDLVHVAAYSPRPGTIAARTLKDDVPAAVKSRRLHEVEKVQAATASEINAGMAGRSLEVLVEGRKNGRWFGRTRSGKLVFFDHDADLLGAMALVEIDRTSPWALQGRLAAPARAGSG